MIYPKILNVEATEDFDLILHFDNGEIKKMNFAYNFSHPYFEKLNNYALFKEVSVKDGNVEWATGQDFCPHTLYEKSVRF